MATLSVYGIKQCDTVRKTLRWLDAEGIEYQFYDFRQAGFSRETLESWLQSTSIELLLNRRSTSWRNLSDVDKQNPDPEHLKTLLLDNPTLVKRPVFVVDGAVIGPGFTADVQATLEQHK
ncbi:MAG: Spx/MgsR family RNA polymerase-binding regulatory protein [Xanthomonadales bacterium]|nr:Spx/MgsR family RNA polymerase-binding regulatory protein [Xanthomonadales bacterium]